MVRVILVRHTASRDHLFALGALGSKEFLVAGDAIIVLVFGNEALSTQSFLAVVTGKAIFVPLLAFILHLLSAWFEYLAASIASGGELVGIAIAAVDFVFFAAEWLVD